MSHRQSWSFFVWFRVWCWGFRICMLKYIYTYLIYICRWVLSPLLMHIRNKAHTCPYAHTSSHALHCAIHACFCVGVKVRVYVKDVSVYICKMHNGLNISSQALYCAMHWYLLVGFQVLGFGFRMRVYICTTRVGLMSRASTCASLRFFECGFRV